MAVNYSAGEAAKVLLPGRDWEGDAGLVPYRVELDNGLTVLASALKPPIKKLSDLHTIDISHNEDTTKVGRTKLLEARRGPRPPPGSKAKRYDLAPDKDFRIELIRSPGEDQEDPLGIRKTPLDAPLF